MYSGSTTVEVKFYYKNREYHVRAKFCPSSGYFSYWDPPEDSYVENFCLLSPKMNSDEEKILIDDLSFWEHLVHSVEEEYNKSELKHQMALNLSFFCTTLFDRKTE